MSLSNYAHNMLHGGKDKRKIRQDFNFAFPRF